MFLAHYVPFVLGISPFSQEKIHSWTEYLNDILTANCNPGLWLGGQLHWTAVTMFSHYFSLYQKNYLTCLRAHP